MVLFAVLLPTTVVVLPIVLYNAHIIIQKLKQGTKADRRCGTLFIILIYYVVCSIYCNSALLININFAAFTSILVRMKKFYYFQRFQKELNSWSYKCVVQNNCGAHNNNNKSAAGLVLLTFTTLII